MKILKFNELKTNKTDFKCKVCGAPLYRTDAGGKTATLQCSSDEARFWDFERGSAEQKTAHKHFQDSIEHIPEEQFEVNERVKKFHNFKKKKKTRPNPKTDKPYSWLPQYNTQSPAPGYQINIIPSKLS